MYEAIIIGGGHNGLVTAASLSKAGRKVLLLEGRDVLGGAAATEEIFPGFKFDTGAHDAALFQDEIVENLSLKAHGLAFQQSPALIFAPQLEGPAFTLWRDTSRSVGEIAALSESDAARYPEFVQQVDRMAQPLRNMMLRTPPDLFDRKLGELAGWGKLGLGVRRQGDQEMMEFLRVLPMAVSDYLDEWFESDSLKGLLGAPGVAGSRQGPRAAGTALMFLYQHICGFQGSRFVAGGMGRLSEVLATAARENGAEIRTAAPVARILLDGDRAIGVALEDGQEIGAVTVASSADPRRTFFDLIGPEKLDPEFVRKVGNILYRGSTAKVNLALSGLPHFNGQTEVEQLGGHIRICPSLEYLERAYDDAKYGRISAEPYLDIVIPTILDPSLAPDGRQVMSVTMQYAPYALSDGEWNDQREALGDLVVETLAQYAPDIKELVLHRQVLSPLDWEATYGLTEGSIYQGQMGMDQLLVMRPVPGWSRYRTPIKNLYLCGAAAHPGGGVSGAPGYNAAREILRG
jgi:phytoene dehydrogenase-like protein